MSVCENGCSVGERCFVLDRNVSRQGKRAAGAGLERLANQPLSTGIGM